MDGRVMRMQFPWCVLVASVLASACAGTKLSRFDDNLGSWQVHAVYENGSGRTPAREFSIKIAQSGGQGLFDVSLYGINTHDRRIRANGKHLAPACREGSPMCKSTLLGCGPRVDVATGEPILDAAVKCAPMQRDESFIERILATPSRWEHRRGGLVIRSDTADASIELRR